MRTSGPSRPSGRRSASTRKARPARSRTVASHALESFDVAVADEHQVDVAGVVELGTAELPHADDRQAVVAARGRRRPCRPPRASTSDARSASAAVVVSTAVDTGEVAAGDAQQLASLPRHQVAQTGRRIASAARRRAASPSASASVGEHARQASARRQHGDQRFGHRLELGRADGAGGRGRPARARDRPSARRARRSREVRRQQRDVGVAAAWPSSSSPRDRADAPISTAPTRHHSTQRRRGPLPSPRPRSRVAAASVAAGSAVSQRIGLGHEPWTVVGRVAHHRLRVDGEPRLALRRQHVGGVEVAVEQHVVLGGGGPRAHRRRGHDGRGLGRVAGRCCEVLLEVVGPRGRGRRSASGRPSGGARRVQARADRRADGRTASSGPPVVDRWP